MAEDVLCEVDNCVYWSEGNKCEAERIYVVSHREHAERTEETDCKTFKPH